ncbi:hypothetical protein V5E97_20025 [Singulisphaera sp. Ch08]|uniref:Uncharacterized protein n=1 Tax=Singulisphaera sp. Ch08 TaxID=3120278 RepID=A0AAU7CRY1_9BACT
MALKGARTTDEYFDEVPVARISSGVPWQIWIVVFMLGLEGIGNLLSIPYQPQAARWLAFKCLAITGLIRGWRFVFWLSLVVAGMHVLGFSLRAPFVAFLNLMDVLLVASSFRHFYPQADSSPHTLKPQVREIHL